MPKTKIVFEEVVVGPAEAERVTGVSMETQRNWRKRGYLENKTDNQGRALFGGLNLCELAFMKTVIDLGLRIGDASEAVKISAFPFASQLGPPQRRNPETDKFIGILPGSKDGEARAVRSRTIEDLSKASLGLKAYIVVNLIAIMEDLEAKLGRPLLSRHESVVDE